MGDTVAVVTNQNRKSKGKNVGKRVKEKPEIVDNPPTQAVAEQVDPSSEQPNPTNQAQDFAGRMKLRYFSKEDGEKFVALMKQVGAYCQVTPLKGKDGYFCYKIKFSGFTVVQDVK